MEDKSILRIQWPSEIITNELSGEIETPRGSDNPDSIVVTAIEFISIWRIRPFLVSEIIANPSSEDNLIAVGQLKSAFVPISSLNEGPPPAIVDTW